MIKKFFAFVTFIVMFNFTVALAAQSIVDTQNLLTANEINELTQKIQKVEQEFQVKIGIEILKNTHGQSLDDAANSLLDKNFSGAPNGGILLLIVMDTHKWKISTDSTMRQRISDEDTEYIAQNFVRHLSNGDYYKACYNYINDVENHLINYYYDESGFTFSPLLAGLGFLLSLICAAIFRSHLINSMSNVHQATNAADYLKRDTVKITETKDTYLFTNVTRRKKNKGSSGSRGGGGGGGGHGGSSGSF